MSSELFTDISLVKNRRPCRNISRPKTNPSEPPKQSYTTIFDNRTMGFYKSARMCHIDPILNVEVDENIAFKFTDQWDPYTGERLGVDPFGPLYFNPISLTYHYYLHRLDGLWKNAVDTPDGYFEGYYDMFVGTGSELEVVGRDKYVELYLFRLPILDCYLTPDHNKSFITVGPKLTDQEILQLDKLCENSVVQEEYHKTFCSKCPSLAKIKSLYDSAISKSVTVPTSCRKQYTIPQYYYVDQLRLI